MTIVAPLIDAPVVGVAVHTVLSGDGISVLLTVSQTPGLVFPSALPIVHDKSIGVEGSQTGPSGFGVHKVRSFIIHRQGPRLVAHAFDGGIPLDPVSPSYRLLGDVDDHFAVKRRRAEGFGDLGAV